MNNQFNPNHYAENTIKVPFNEVFYGDTIDGRKVEKIRMNVDGVRIDIVFVDGSVLTGFRTTNIRVDKVIAHRS